MRHNEVKLSARCSENWQVAEINIYNDTSSNSTRSSTETDQTDTNTEPLFHYSMKNVIF